MRQGCTLSAVADVAANTLELVPILGAFWNHVSLPNATLLARLGEILYRVCRATTSGKLRDEAAQHTRHVHCFGKTRS